MEAKGKIITCNRCGKVTFLKYLGLDDLDGGFTTFDKYEKLPDSWMYMSQIGDLCPDCAHKFKSFIKEFMGDKPIAAAWKLKEEKSNET